MTTAETIANLQREIDLLHETLAGVLAIACDCGPYMGDEGMVIEAAERLVRQREPDPRQLDLKAAGWDMGMVTSTPTCAKCGYGRTRHTATQDLGHAFVEAGAVDA